MRVFQALRRIAALKGDIARIDTRLPAGMAYKKDEGEPSFPYTTDIATREALVDELVQLKMRLTHTNCHTDIHVPRPGKEPRRISVQQAVYEMAEIKNLIALTQRLPVGPKETWTMQEPRGVTANPAAGFMTNFALVENVRYLTERGKDDLIRDLEEKFATLNNEVESKNHETELMTP